MAADQKMQELKDAVKRLKRGNQFGQAREELERALVTVPKETEEYVWVQQQRALCTYKDTQLRPDAKFTAALGILKQIGLCKPGMKNPETLGLGGAIYKRMWEHEGKEEHLRASLALYRAGWESYKDAPQRKSAEGQLAFPAAPPLPPNRPTRRTCGGWTSKSSWRWGKGVCSRRGSSILGCGASHGFFSS